MKRWYAHRIYIKYYRCIVKTNLKIDFSKSVEGEKEWLKKWQQLDSRVSPFAYRIFSQYIGPNINILPLETSVNYIENILNPLEYQAPYCDKNFFDKIFGIENTLGTIFRRMGGVFYTKDYTPIIQFSNEQLKEILSEYNKIVLKKSIDSNSGKGVWLFEKDMNGDWFSNQDKLTIELLNSWDLDNFIVQNWWQQSEELAFFNSTSVNTIRICAYRSVKTGEIHISSAILRIGSSGSHVDNAHGGGMFVGIDKEGNIKSRPTTFLGAQQDTFNGIDFKNNNYKIPNWDNICKFVKEQSKKIIHHHILAYDITLDPSNEPHICEVNVDAFSAWLYQFVSSPTFDEYTDEILNYCIKHKHPKNVTFKFKLH